MCQNSEWKISYMKVQLFVSVACFLILLAEREKTMF